MLQTFLAMCGGVLLFAAPASARETKGGSSGGAPTQAQSAPDPAEARALEVLHAYVRRTRGWSASQYWIERKSASIEGYVGYHVVFLADLKPPVVAGSGSSFAVDYDPVRGQVVKEYAFQ